MDIVPSEPLARDISELDADALVRMLIEGRDEPPGPLAKALNESGYVLPPLPNCSSPATAASSRAGM